jgi:hypothetical protein
MDFTYYYFRISYYYKYNLPYYTEVWTTGLEVHIILGFHTITNTIYTTIQWYGQRALRYRAV